MAESLKDIRRRINSVKSTQKITKAMKMVAAAKLKKAEGRAKSFAPYASEINVTLRSVMSRIEAVDSVALSESRTDTGIAVLLVAGDRGLCGGFNSTLFRRFDEWMAGQNADEIEFYTVGRKAADYVRKRGYNLVESLAMLPEPPAQSQLDTIEEWLSKSFLDAKVGSAYVAYSKYESPLTQVPAIQKVLPFETESESEEAAAVPFLTDIPTDELVEKLVNDAFKAQVTTVILDNQAGEHGARMTAMDAATNNASDMIDKLTIRYNRARQAAITNELMDIVNGAESIK